MGTNHAHFARGKKRVHVRHNEIETSGDIRRQHKSSHETRIAGFLFVSQVLHVGWLGVFVKEWRGFRTENIKLSQNDVFSQQDSFLQDALVT